MKQRDKWLRECEGFGWDDKTGTGFAPDTETCKACSNSSPERFDACRDEVESAKVVLRKIKETKKETIVTEETLETIETVEAEVVEPAVAEKSKRITKVEALVYAMKENQQPQSAKELLAKVNSITGGRDNQFAVGLLMKFGQLLGVVEEVEGGYRLVK